MRTCSDRKISVNLSWFILALLLSLPLQAHAEKPRKILRYSMYCSSIGTTENRDTDPLRTLQLHFFDLQHQIFETLVSFNADTQKIEPVLAESWKKVSDTTIRFFLRRGVRFHNGEPFTAESVKFTYDLMIDPRNRFPGRFLLKNITAVQVIDDYTVDVVLSFPDALILRKIGTIGFLFPPDYYRRVGDAYFIRYPIGTGPFRNFYKEEHPRWGQEYHLVANEDYWGKRPSIDELVYIEIPHAGQWNALKRGDIDLLITQHIDPAEKPHADKHLKILSRTATRASAVLMNIDKEGPLQNLNVRRALEHAVSRDKIISSALNGFGRPIYSTIPEGTVGKKLKKPVYPESIAAARSLLKKAGYPQGCRLSVMAGDHQPARSVAGHLQQHFAKAGIELAVDYVSRNDVLKQIVEPKLQGTFRHSSYDLWILTDWPILFGTCTHFYFLFFHSDGMFNIGISAGQKSEINRYYRDITHSSNSREFRKNLQRLDSYLIDRALVLPLYQPALLYAMNKTVDFDPGMQTLPHRFVECRIKD